MNAAQKKKRLPETQNQRQWERGLRKINLQTGFPIIKSISKRIRSVSGEYFVGLGLVNWNTNLGIKVRFVAATNWNCSDGLRDRDSIARKRMGCGEGRECRERRELRERAEREGSVRRWKGHGNGHVPGEAEDRWRWWWDDKEFEALPQKSSQPLLFFFVPSWNINV